MNALRSRIAAALAALGIALGIGAPEAGAAPRRSPSPGLDLPVAVSGAWVTVQPRAGVTTAYLRESLSRSVGVAARDIRAGRDGGPILLRLPAPGDHRWIGAAREIAWALPALELPDGRPLGLSGEVVLLLAEGADDTAVEARIHGLGGRISARLPRLGALRVSLGEPASLSVEAIFEACTALRGEPGVLDAHPNFVRGRAERRAMNDPRSGRQWHLEKVGLPAAFEITTGRPEVVIAVVDDGFDLDHEDLPGPERRAGGLDLLDGDDDPSAGPGDDHGTAVAGIALASGDNCKGITGACPGCGFLPVRRGSTDYDDMMAFDALTGAGVHVVNCSWGYTHPPTGVVAALRALMEKGRDGKGTLVVFAAGNEGRDIDATADIAATPGVLAVAGTGPDDAPAAGTNHGASIGVTAPGRGLVTTDRTIEGYEAGRYLMSFDGTSGAAPIVAGAAGLVFSVDPQRAATEVRDLVVKTAAPVVGGASFGRLDAARAVAEAAGVDPSALGRAAIPAPWCDASAGAASCTASARADRRRDVPAAPILVSAAIAAMWAARRTRRRLP